MKKFYYDIANTPEGARFQPMVKLPVPEKGWMLRVNVNKRLEGLHDIVYTVNGKEYPGKFGEPLVIDLGPVWVNTYTFRAKYGEVDVQAEMTIDNSQKFKKK